MLQADPRKVSMRAKKRGLPQLGTLGMHIHSFCIILLHFYIHGIASTQNYSINLTTLTLLTLQGFCCIAALLGLLKLEIVYSTLLIV